MRLRVAVIVFAAFFVLVSGTWAGVVPISITNFSFESPSCGSVGPAACAPTGWTVTGSADAFLPAAGTWPSVPDGVQIAYSNGPTGVLSQVLTTDIVANTEYTLSVWVSGRVGGTFGPEISLLGGSTTLFTMNESNPGGANPTEVSDGSTYYTWVDWVMSWTSPSSGPLIGQPLEISLSADAVQTDFDAVTMVSGAPEPAMFALVGAGLLGLVVRRRFAK